MADEQSHLSVTQTGEVRIVEFADSKILDELAISEIGEELTQIIDNQTESHSKLLLCFRNVEHLSSAALGMLIMLNKKVAQRQGSLKLSDISPQIFEVFKITRLNKLFDIYDTAGQALKAF